MEMLAHVLRCELNKNWIRKGAIYLLSFYLPAGVSAVNGYYVNNIICPKY